MPPAVGGSGRPGNGTPRTASRTPRCLRHEHAPLRINTPASFRRTRPMPTVANQRPRPPRAATSAPRDAAAVDRGRRRDARDLHAAPVSRLLAVLPFFSPDEISALASYLEDRFVLRLRRFARTRGSSPPPRRHTRLPTPAAGSTRRAATPDARPAAAARPRRAASPNARTPSLPRTAASSTGRPES